MAESTIDTGAIERLRRIGGTALAKQMIDVYLAHAPQRVEAIVRGGEVGDVRALRRGAHSLKSTSANVGATAVQRLAAELELLAAAAEDGESAGNASSQQLTSGAAEVERAFAAARAELQRIREELGP